MQLHLHPTRHEALTASETALTRWSLDTNPATILAQLSFEQGSLFTLMYEGPGGRAQFYGGVTGSADGLLFALEQPQSRASRSADGLVLEWRNVADLSLARTRVMPQMSAEILSLASSPDGRWLVIAPGAPERLFLLDWQTGEVMSHHAIAGCLTSGWTFDPTSTFVAGYACHDNWGHCIVFRLDPAARALVRPQGEPWWAWSSLDPFRQCRGDVSQRKDNRHHNSIRGKVHYYLSSAKPEGPARSCRALWLGYCTAIVANPYPRL